MYDANTAAAASALFRELTSGPPSGWAFVLNQGDEGLLASLDRLTAEDASRRTAGGTSVAAHMEHVHYGLSLMTRWADGENPFADADWAAAWRKPDVSGAEWDDLRSRLRHQAERWLEVLSTERDVNPLEMNGMIGSVVHLAYHIGAARQISSTLKGPPETA